MARQEYLDYRADQARPRMERVAQARLRGESVRQIAKAEGVSPAMIQKVIDRAREKGLL